MRGREVGKVGKILVKEVMEMNGSRLNEKRRSWENNN